MKKKVQIQFNKQSRGCLLCHPPPVINIRQKSQKEEREASASANSIEEITIILISFSHSGSSWRKSENPIDPIKPHPIPKNTYEGRQEREPDSKSMAGKIGYIIKIILVLIVNQLIKPSSY